MTNKIKVDQKQPMLLLVDSEASIGFSMEEFPQVQQMPPRSRYCCPTSVLPTILLPQLEGVSKVNSSGMASLLVDPCSWGCVAGA